MHKQTLSINVISPWQIKDGKATAPVLCAVEGVHHGSAGPLFWSADVLKQSVEKFHNVPVTLRHPVNEAGKFCSVHYSLESATRYTRGRMVNPTYDPAAKGIRATLEIPTTAPDFSTIQGIKNVSVGAYTEDDYTAGVWQGKSYSGIVKKIDEIDHIALLPDEFPACVGTGIKAAQQSEDEIKQIFENALQTLINKRGGNQMDEILLPASYSLNKEQAPDLEAMQAQADKDNVLLPTEFNRSACTKQVQDDEDVLLPCGF